jgi:hypothetical protein
LKVFHEKLAADLVFFTKKAILYYNRHCSIEPMLKEGDKVYLIRRNIQTKQPSTKLDHKKLGLFKIKRVAGLVNYELVLPKTMNIHPVFHISLLEPVLLEALLAPVTKIEPVNPSAEYEVEEWTDYPHSENT